MAQILCNPGGDFGVFSYGLGAPGLHAATRLESAGCQGKRSNEEASNEPETSLKRA